MYAIYICAKVDTEVQVESLRNLLKGHMLRRMKSDVNITIPEKHELIVRVEMKEQQKELYKVKKKRERERERKSKHIRHTCICMHITHR
jgi:SNF2 family DNA or RNA helicase